MKFNIRGLKGLLNNSNVRQNESAQCFNKSDATEGGARSKEGYREDMQRNNSSPQMRSRMGVGCSENGTNRDLGNAPYAFDIQSATNSNRDYRAALWTGKHLQLTVMSIPVGSETGVEMHNGLDQFIRVESGSGKVEMGRLRSNMNYTVPLDSRYAVLIPEGTYHNIINTGRVPLKLYSIYTPKAHPFGTVDATKEDSKRHEGD